VLTVDLVRRGAARHARRTAVVCEAPLAIAVLDADDHRDPTLLGSCGHPSVDAKVAVTGQDGTPVAAGEVGEVRVRAPFGMAGATCPWSTGPRT
jgi:hypothetical protein